MSDSKAFSRRHFIVGSVSAASLAAGIGAGSLVRPGAARAAELEWPLPCADLNNQPVLEPDRVRWYAYNRYFQGGCMYGAAGGLLQAFKEAFRGRATGWDLLPYNMYRYGAGGVAGWGTLCGILNGCLAVLNLIDLHGYLGHHLMGWYATTFFPAANCEGFVTDSGIAAIPDEDVLAHTVSDSPLCHISIGKWCKAAGVSITDTTPEGLRYKDDRCSKICADAAAKTAELINETLNDGISQPFEIPSTYASCVDCHGILKDQVGKMDCRGCHTPADVVQIGRRHP